MYRSHRANCGTVWRCHIPFCPKVKGIPSFEWLKIKEGKPQEIPQYSKNSPERMHDICMLLDARIILEWAFHSVNLTAAKRP